jgi:putative Mn2+ efflux pump MntP
MKCISLTITLDISSLSVVSLKSFIRQYDWYSLGILLFQIGLWAAIEDIMVEHTKKNEEFATVLVEEKLHVLAFHMDAEYSEIAKFCFTCSEQSLPTR